MDDHPVHFGLLGPLEVAHGDRLLDLGRPKQRTVLAALLIHSNRVVSLDRFADILWPGEVTARSPGSLPVYIANLRRLVEPARPARTPPQRILTRPPGYLLRTAAGEYDVADFERLAAEGNRHLAEGRPRAARRTLGEGLALWRGRAMDEFPFAELEALRLEGIRVAATEDRLDADLTLGAHTAVVAELEALIDEHGLRERLVRLLMVALYRSGRQADALRAYSTAGDRLRRELGIVPGPDLRRLEAEILAQSPTMDWRPPPAEGLSDPVVAETAPPPFATSDPFFGRVAELSALRGALAGATVAPGGVVLVSGEPGIGKTRLVQEAVTGAAGRGGVVVWGRSEEGDGAPPFWPWIQIVRTLLEHPDTDALQSALRRHGSELGQLIPDVKAVTRELAAPPMVEAAAARYRFLDAVGGFVAHLAKHRPLVIVLDDLHWADPPTLQLTEHVARAVRDFGVRLVATYRQVDPAPEGGLAETLATLARLPGVLHLALEGLSENEVAEFITQKQVRPGRASSPQCGPGPPVTRSS